MGMLERCSRTNHPAFHRYGGRGITVCQRWRESFWAFVEDMGERPAGASIERIDNDKGYEPGNCKWATSKEQQRNRCNNRRIEFNGQTRTMAEWSEVTGIKLSALKNRLGSRLKWSPERALTTPVEYRKPR
jgi:hypothetical protein